MQDAECGPLDPAMWREAPLPDDPEQRARRLRISGMMFERAFKVPGWDEKSMGPSPIPFYELPPEDVEVMRRTSKLLYDDYQAQLAAASDPRSGPRVVPYVPAEELATEELTL